MSMKLIRLLQNLPNKGRECRRKMSHCIQARVQSATALTKRKLKACLGSLKADAQHSILYIVRDIKLYMLIGHGE